MQLADLTWVYQVSWGVTAFLGGSVLVFGLSWWLIFRRTIQRFITGDHRRDQ